ncbi:hypothetical protein [Sphingomonas sp. NFR15]|uniref:hypothetical protein n=1 Tax=Sphingomonas sp. NFR15 TaxID=1566282 RepID=UPI00088A5003|nr:hypothetical protein [Sphingomonas sp. NFR15]SDA21512.1 hypothetical protein SAMN03159340_01454 [Sphingomonas sp. NFR15]
MSLLLIFWLVLAFAACGVGAWLTMAGAISGDRAQDFVGNVHARIVHVISCAIRAGIGLLLFNVGAAMIGRVLG